MSEEAEAAQRREQEVLAEERRKMEALEQKMREAERASRAAVRRRGR